MHFPVFLFLLLSSACPHVQTTPLSGGQNRAVELDISNDVITRNRTIQFEGFVGLFHYFLFPALRFHLLGVCRIFSPSPR